MILNGSLSCGLKKCFRRPEQVYDRAHQWVRTHLGERCTAKLVSVHPRPGPEGRTVPGASSQRLAPLCARWKSLQWVLKGTKKMWDHQQPGSSLQNPWQGAKMFGNGKAVAKWKMRPSKRIQVCWSWCWQTLQPRCSTPTSTCPLSPAFTISTTPCHMPWRRSISADQKLLAFSMQICPKTWVLLKLISLWFFNVFEATPRKWLNLSSKFVIFLSFTPGNREIVETWLELDPHLEAAWQPVYFLAFWFCKTAIPNLKCKLPSKRKICDITFGGFCLKIESSPWPNRGFALATLWKGLSRPSLWCRVTRQMWWSPAGPLVLRCFEMLIDYRCYRLMAYGGWKS